MSQLIMYSRNACPNCEAVVEQLDKIGIGYTKIMVDDNYKAKAKLLASGFDAVPVLDLGDNILIGGSVDTIVLAAIELTGNKAS